MKNKHENKKSKQRCLYHAYISCIDLFTHLSKLYNSVKGRDCGAKFYINYQKKELKFPKSSLTLCVAPIGKEKSHSERRKRP